MPTLASCWILCVTIPFGVTGHYTAALIKNLMKPGVTVTEMLDTVANAVMESSNGKQNPVRVHHHREIPLNERTLSICCKLVSFELWLHAPSLPGH